MIYQGQKLYFKKIGFLSKFVTDANSVLLLNGFRFFFYSNENNEPIHIHIEKGNATGKVWLDPLIEIAYMRDFTKRNRFYNENNHNEF